MKAPLRLALLVTTALGVTAPAFAQEGGAQGSSDIVVTARRVEERLQDVPISITVFNQEQLSKRNVTNAQDLATFTPSLSATTNFGAENSTFAIRGFVQQTGTGPSVGVYFGDVVAPRGASQGFPAGDGAGPGSFFDLQNVQVLKGPQGTLFGRNTTGGAVLLVPQKPTGDFEGYVEGSIGNFDMRRVQAVINAPLAETVRLRLSGDYQTRDGYMINDSGIGPRDFDNINYFSLRASLVIDLTPEIENYTIASYTKSDNNGHVQKLIACNPTQSAANFLGLLACAQLAKQTNGFYHLRSDMPDPYSKLRQGQIINTTTWLATDDLTVKNIVSFARLNTRIHSDLFGTNFVIPRGSLAAPIPGVFPGFPATDTPLGFAVIRNIPGGFSSNQDTFTEEFRLQGTSFDNRFNWQAGAYYENSTPNGFIGSQSPVLIGCSDPDRLICTDLLGIGVVNYTVAQNSARTIGLYGQGTFNLTDQLKLTGGIRYTWDRVRSISRGLTYSFPQGVPNAPANPARCTLAPVAGQPNSGLPNCEIDRSANFDAPTWLIGLDYKPTEDILLYGKYSRGYRSGGIKSDVPDQFVVFQPEKVDSFEIGAKTSFEGAVSGTFNISGFYNNFSNQQLQLGFNTNFNRRTAGGAPLPTVGVTSTAGPFNIGKSRIYGLEVDTQIRPFEGLTLDGSYAYINTRVKEVIIPSLPSDSIYALSATATAGDELILTPKHQFTISAAYTLPLEESVGRVTFGATYSYTARQRANYDNRRVTNITNGVDLGVLGSRNLVNLNLDWDSIGGGPIDLSLFVTNLTRQKYYTFVPGLLGAIGSEVATIGEPRIFGARLKFRFGADAR